MENSLLNKIKQDLEKTGLGSELKAIKIFEKFDFMTLSGHNYLDKDENKLREIDIVSVRNMTTKFRDVKFDYYIFNSLVIVAEVKKSEKPWVVFKSNYQDSSFNYTNCLKRVKLNKSNNVMIFRELEESFTQEWNLKVNGIHEAFKSPNNPSRWYGACMSAIKATIESFEKNCLSDEENEKNEEYEKYENYYDNFQPLIILDGTLVSAEMDENYEIKVEEVLFSKIDIKLESNKYKESTYQVDIVTLKGLEKYLEMMKKQQLLVNEAIVKFEEFDKTKCSTFF